MGSGAKPQDLSNIWLIQHPRWLKTKFVAFLTSKLIDLLGVKSNVGKISSNKTVHYLPLSQRAHWLGWKFQIQLCLETITVIAAPQFEARNLVTIIPQHSIATYSVIVSRCCYFVIFIKFLHKCWTVLIFVSYIPFQKLSFIIYIHF